MSVQLSENQKIRLSVAEELAKHQFATAATIARMVPFATPGHAPTTADIAAIALVLATNFQTQTQQSK